MTEPWWHPLDIKACEWDLGPCPEMNGVVTTDQHLKKHREAFRRHRVKLKWRGSGWAIVDFYECLSKSGEWVYVNPPVLTDEWILEHRWQDPEEAKAFYRSWLAKFMDKRFNEIMDDLVGKWHDSNTGLTLHSYLGLTEREYSRWVEDQDTLNEIIGKVIEKRGIQSRRNRES